MKLNRQDLEISKNTTRVPSSSNVLGVVQITLAVQMNRVVQVYVLSSSNVLRVVQMYLTSFELLDSFTSISFKVS